MSTEQIVSIDLNDAPCKNCGANLIDIANYAYDGKTETTATVREEHCKCKKCGTSFILHYDLFDEEGHIYSKVFTEDVNNPSYNWQDALTEDQKSVISEHLKGCSICVDRLSMENLTDAWLRDFINMLRKNRVQL
jgi:hypothetical protein